MDPGQTAGARNENQDEVSATSPALLTVAPAKARALLFGTLAILWIFPSLGALWILASDSRRWVKSGFVALIGSAAIEDWVAMALLATHLVFTCLAFRFKAKANADLAASSLVKTPNCVDDVPSARD